MSDLSIVVPSEGYSHRCRMSLVAVGGLLIAMGFSCCRAQALGAWTSVVVMLRLSCPTVCGILPPKDQTVSPALPSGLLTTGPPGRSPKLTSWQCWVFLAMNMEYLSIYLVLWFCYPNFCQFPHTDLVHILLDLCLNVCNINDIVFLISNVHC